MCKETLVTTVICALAALVAAVQSAAGQEALPDLDGVHAMLDAGEQAWADRDVQAVMDNFSDDMVLVVDPPGRAEGALVLDKEAAAAALTTFFAGDRRP